MNYNLAIFKGYTKETCAFNRFEVFHLFIKPSSNLKKWFSAYDVKADKFIRVHGWSYVFEDIKQHQIIKQAA